MGRYNKHGLYAGYDKNHKERDKLDYYSTPTEEVLNILNIIKPDLTDFKILEPCAGGGHMLLGIHKYIESLPQEKRPFSIQATDIHPHEDVSGLGIAAGPEYDFITDTYPITDVDFIIMNPPYGIIEPFVMKALSTAREGVLMLARLQFLEGEKRYTHIFSELPPTDIYTYVDRIACYKNGILTEKPGTIQAYAWFYWDLNKFNRDCELPITIHHWIRRVGK